MKKIIVLMVSLFAGMGMTFAQNFKLEANGSVVTEGQILEMKGSGRSIEQHFVLTNTSESAMEFQAEFSTDSIPEGAGMSICGFGGCMTGNTLGPIMMDPGQVTGTGLEPFDIAYTPNADKDECTTTCIFTDLTAGKSLTFKIHFIPEKGVANESRELAGVSVYPNPANGLFNLNVPARAQVEIFSANGQVVRQMEVGAGQTSLQLNNAGIYFIRVRANGKEAVKRLVIR